MQDRTYILKWRHGVSPEIRWFLRGIRGDGSFWGELLSVWEVRVVIDGNPRKGVGKTIEGTLSPTDRSRFEELVAGFGPGTELLEGWTGLLAEGPMKSCTIRFCYVPGDEQESSEAARFLAVIDLLERYIRPSYAELIRRDQRPEAAE
jgi:hypothetical protein